MANVWSTPRPRHAISDPIQSPRLGLALAFTLMGREIYTAGQAFFVAGNSCNAWRPRKYGPVLAGWYPSRELKLLYLTTNWPVLNGASASMMMDDKSTTQAWARAIDDRYNHEIDGLYHLSSITSEPLVTLFRRTEAIPAFPARVAFSTPLSAAAADEIVYHARKNLSYSSS